ncbi:MAG: hydrogenase [Bacteroidetes bacterium]|nr:hydrogenase [Bacteroidota bacterium]
MTNILWLKGGACSGNTMSFLGAEEPNVVELITDFGINILYHPTLALEIGKQVSNLLRDILKGKMEVDIFVFEGSVIQGPSGSGAMNYFADRPMIDWINDIAPIAKYVVAVGDCAAWGGIPAVPPNPTESTGLQFHKDQYGGFLSAEFRSKAGVPVINIPGCPAHPDWMTQILVALATGRVKDIVLDELNRPKTFFTDFVQTGCPNTMSFATRVEGGFGKRGGCLFYEVGCRGPLSRATCNRILWNRHSSKTRANHPCLGCTEPGFPHHDLEKGSVFKTMKYLGFAPLDVPTGSSQLGYYAYSGAQNAPVSAEKALGTLDSSSETP